MPVLNRFSPAFRAYIREEYRRVWTRREYLTLFIALVVVEVIRIAVTWLILPSLNRPGLSVLELLGPVGLTSGVTITRVFSSRMVPGWLWPFWAVGEFLSGFVVLAPYYAGRSVASARKFGEVDDLRTRGLFVNEILLGRGLVHLAPFLTVIPVDALMALTSSVGMHYAGGRGSRPGFVPYNDPLVFGVQLLLLLTAYPIGNIARLATMVCVSGLTRRIWGGIAACYGLSLVISPLLATVVRHSAGGTLTPTITTQTYLVRIILPNVLNVLLQVAVFAALLPLARRALAGKPPVPLPKMDEPRNLWLDEGDHAAATGE